jgi:hypothetical protein
MNRSIAPSFSGAPATGAGEGGAGDGFVRPVILVDGALLDPTLDEGALRGRERFFVRVGRRHDLVGILAEDALPGLGVGEVAGDEGAHAAAVGGGGGGLVEAEFSLAIRGVAAVAGEAVVGEDGPDVFVKRDVFLGGRAGGRREGQEAEKPAVGGDHGDEGERKAGEFAAMAGALSLN